MLGFPGYAGIHGVCWDGRGISPVQECSGTPIFFFSESDVSICATSVTDFSVFCNGGDSRATPPRQIQQRLRNLHECPLNLAPDCAPGRSGAKPPWPIQRHLCASSSVYRISYTSFKVSGVGGKSDATTPRQNRRLFRATTTDREIIETSLRKRRSESLARRVLHGSSSSPGFTPPFRNRVQLVQELPVVGRNRAVAARPSLLPENDGGQRALLLVNEAMALASPLALLHLLAQLAHSFFSASNALHALKLLAIVILVVIELYLLEPARPITAGARLACVRLQVTRVEP